MMNTKAYARIEVGTRRTDVRVARMYLERGFLDAAIPLFARNPGGVEADDWHELRDKRELRLLERGPITPAVTVCETGGCPLPREKFLAMGDEQLRRKDFDGAIHFYELGEADRERWATVVDQLAALPGRELRTLAIAERYLADEDDTETDADLPSAPQHSIALH